MNNKQVADVMREMIAYSDGNLHDIAHFMKVYAYAETIGIEEGLPDGEQETLEIAAILHDIACPLCREKYGSTDGKYQEKEGTVLAEAFLRRFDLPQSMKERVVYLVGHHHTYSNVDGHDYRILLEADFLVNADESNMSADMIRTARERLFKTAAGAALLDAVYSGKGK